MKKSALIFATALTLFLAAVSTATAQEKGNFGLGVRNSLYTHTGHGAKYGIGLFFRYNPFDGMRIEPSIMYVCGKNCSIDLAVNVEYMFGINKTMWIYPIVGFGVNEINRWSASFNFGVGYDWAMTRHWILSGNVKYMVQTADHRYLKNPITPSIGVSYRF